MALESLVLNPNKDLSIHDLHPVEERRAGYPVELYHRLQNSPLRDQEEEIWHSSMSKDFILSLSFFPQADNQLLGLLASMDTFGDKKERKNFEILKNKFYDKEKSYWMHCGIENRSHAINTYNQLLGILTEYTYNPEHAGEQFKRLKNTGLWDKEKNRWLLGINYAGTRTIPTFLLDYQLLGVWVEHLFDPERAKETYESIKEDWNLWDYSTSTETSNRLLAVRAEQLFNPQNAEKRYKELKETEHWNPDTELWRDEGSASESPGYRVNDQFLGIILEKLFKRAEVLAKPEDPVPVVRRF